MSHLIEMMTRDQDEIIKIFNVAKNSPKTTASEEFYQATAELFGPKKPNGRLAFQAAYVNDKWAPLVSFLGDPIVRRYLNHLIVKRYFFMLPRDSAVSLLKDLDPRYRSKLAPKLRDLSDRGVLDLIMDTLRAKIAKAVPTGK